MFLEAYAMAERSQLLGFLTTAVTVPGIYQSRGRPRYTFYVVETVARFELCCLHLISYLLTISDFLPIILLYMDTHCTFT